MMVGERGDAGPGNPLARGDGDRLAWPGVLPPQRARAEAHYGSTLTYQIFKVAHTCFSTCSCPLATVDVLFCFLLPTYLHTYSCATPMCLSMYAEYVCARLSLPSYNGV